MILLPATLLTGVGLKATPAKLLMTLSTMHGQTKPAIFIAPHIGPKQPGK